MKKYLVMLASLSLAGAVFVGCDDDDDDPIGGDGNGNDEECIDDSECGGFICDIDEDDEDAVGECLETCEDQSECADGYTCEDNGLCEQDADGDATYSRVLLVSTTPNDKDEGDACRAPNPGPDIDYVELLNAGGEHGPSSVSGDHGGDCGSQATDPWADPSVVEQKLSYDADPDDPNFCDTEDSHTKYFFMGMGGSYLDDGVIGGPGEDGETDNQTGYLVVEFDDAFEDGDQIVVYEVGKEEGNFDGDDGKQLCNNVTKARENDTYDVYFVADGADVEIGTEISGENFVKAGEGIGVSSFIFIEE